MSHFSWLHHLHKRKRHSKVRKNLKPYPHPNPRISLLDNLVLLVGVLGPMSNIPQIAKIFIEQTVEGLSLLTWMMLAVFTVPWLVYGFVHKAKPIIVANTLWLASQIVVLIGIFSFS